MNVHAEHYGIRLLSTTLALACCAALANACAAPDSEPPGDDVGRAQQGAAASLPSYNVHITDTSVSGLSSGAFFAGQMGVAFSSIIKGVGIVAGGPYDCAGEMGYYSCMYSSSPSVSTSISNTKTWSGSTIDAYANMASQQIYMFSGSSDTTVATSVMNQVYSYYVTSGSFVPSGNVSYDKSHNTAHTFPTDFDSTGNNACTTAASPYISNCSFDGAGAILQHIYGTLNARNNGTLGGSIISFDQSEFLSNPNSYGMDTTGWAYVPAACASGAQCKLHVAFHGCVQNYASIGDKFIKNTGYNRWADTNDIIVLYPQTVADSTNHNPSPSNAGANNNACWDWVGYYGTDFDRKSGVQMAAIKKMIDRVSSGYTGAADGGTSDAGTSDAGTSDGGTSDGGTSDGGTSDGGTTPVCFTASNYAHVLAGRAHDSLGIAYANGSNQSMGLDNLFYSTTLEQTGTNYYVIGTCP
jgi:poly(3-hydroxybutyrate) depolymerase